MVSLLFCLSQLLGCCDYSPEPLWPTYVFLPNEKWHWNAQQLLEATGNNSVKLNGPGGLKHSSIISVSLFPTEIQMETWAPGAMWRSMRTASTGSTAIFLPARVRLPHPLMTWGLSIKLTTEGTAQVNSCCWVSVVSAERYHGLRASTSLVEFSSTRNAQFLAYHFLGVFQVGKLNEKSHFWYYLASISLKNDSNWSHRTHSSSIHSIYCVFNDDS